MLVNLENEGRDFVDGLNKLSTETTAAKNAAITQALLFEKARNEIDFLKTSRDEQHTLFEQEIKVNDAKLQNENTNRINLGINADKQKTLFDREEKVQNLNLQQTQFNLDSNKASRKNNVQNKAITGFVVNYLNGITDPTESLEENLTIDKFQEYVSNHVTALTLLPDDIKSLETVTLENMYSQLQNMTSKDFFDSLKNHDTAKSMLIDKSIHITDKIIEDADDYKVYKKALTIHTSCLNNINLRDRQKCSNAESIYTKFKDSAKRLEEAHSLVHNSGENRTLNSLANGMTRYLAEVNKGKGINLDTIMTSIMTDYRLTEAYNLGKSNRIESIYTAINSGDVTQLKADANTEAIRDELIAFQSAFNATQDCKKNGSDCIKANKVLENAKASLLTKYESRINGNFFKRKTAGAYVNLDHSYDVHGVNKGDVSKLLGGASVNGLNQTEHVIPFSTLTQNFKNNEEFQKFAKDNKVDLGNREDFIAFLSKYKNNTFNVNNNRVSLGSLHEVIVAGDNLVNVNSVANQTHQNFSMCFTDCKDIDKDTEISLEDETPSIRIGYAFAVLGALRQFKDLADGIGTSDGNPNVLATDIYNNQKNALSYANYYINSKQFDQDVESLSDSTLSARLIRAKQLKSMD